MNSYSIFLIVCSIFWISLSAFHLPATSDSSTLKLLHVIFRHGERNPDLSSLIPGSPYFNESNYLEGYGQLTNAGKRTEYKLGKLLRQRYDKFLTDEWNINFLAARSTDLNRTKMSLELVLAGLYPPKLYQIWSEDDIPWQPIPYNYVPSTEDKEFRFNLACPKFQHLLNDILESPEISSYIYKRYKEILNTLSNKTGRQIITVDDAFNYNFGFLIQQQLGYPLEDWVNSLYPDIYSAAIDHYYLYTNTTKIRRLSAGFALKNILADTKAKIEDQITPSNRKLFLYSAHENNIGIILLALDAFKITQIPPYGSYIVFEIHEVLGIWGIKLFYQNYSNVRYEPVPVKIPGCSYFCPFETFSELVAEILPDSDDECFYQ